MVPNNLISRYHVKRSDTHYIEPSKYCNTVGDFLNSYPKKYPVYLSDRYESSLILITGQDDILDKVKDYHLIDYREMDIELPRASINRYSPANIQDTHIKVCIIFAVNNSK